LFGISTERIDNRNMKILLVGESCVDEYVYGTCERVCPEAAAMCFKSSGQFKQTGGMAANVLANLKFLKPSIDIEVVTNTSTITKRRFVDLRYNTIVFREDHSDACDRGNFKDLSFNEYDAIVFSDYCKGFITEEDIKYISSQARPEAPKFIDTKKRLGSFLDGIDFVKINQDEFDRNCDNLENILSYCKNLVVTCGRNGAKHYKKEFNQKPPSVPYSIEITEYSAEKVPVRDVCGAGDTFLASLVVQYLETQNIGDSINYANYKAAEVVKKFGVTVP